MLGTSGLQVALLLENYVNRPARELECLPFGGPVARPCSNALIWEEGTPTGTVCLFFALSLAAGWCPGRRVPLPARIQNSIHRRRATDGTIGGTASH
jgi:hypothetical protein